MIYISSEAGVRLATRKRAMDELGAQFEKALNATPIPQDLPDLHTKYLESRQSFIEAAEDLADELIELKHHEREGD